MDKNTRWFSSGYLQSKPENVDRDQGIIRGVSVCTVGEAKGHGVSLDSDFIGEVAKQGGELKQGLKARFGHPNMCSTALGTFLGRFKNFVVDGNQCKADLFLSNEAKETPNGDLYSYVLNMAENESDMFGTSIVFTRGRLYRRDEKGNKILEPGSPMEEGEKVATWKEWEEIKGDTFIECKKLHACDCVDEPAANDGLFSAFANETIAGQITEFLDLNPQIFEVAKSNPEIIQALSKYGDKLDEFLDAYSKYKEGGKVEIEKLNESEEIVNDNEDNKEIETVETEAETTEETETETETENQETAESETEQETEETEEEKPEEKAMSVAEFSKIKKEFGVEIASEIFESGKTYNDALQMAFAKQKKRIEELESLNKENGNHEDGKPVPVVSATKKSGLFKTGK